MQKKTVIKIAIPILVLAVVSIVIANFFLWNTQAAPPNSSLPQTHDSSMLLLETRNSDFSSSFFNVMTTGKRSEIIFKTKESYPAAAKVKAVWGVLNYDFFVYDKDGKTVCYQFDVSDWSAGLEFVVKENESGQDEAFLVDSQSGKMKAYDKNNVPSDVLKNAKTYCGANEENAQNMEESGVR